MPATLLPNNSTPWEQAAEATGTARFPGLDPGLVKSAIDPYTIPAQLLPWLAWHYSVDIWNPDWSEAEKRWVIATEIRRKRLKGTLGGLKAYLGLVNTTVVAAIRPPGKTYLSPAMTDAQRAAYLALFPQLRVLPYVAGLTNKYATFANVAYGFAQAFVGKMYPAATQVEERYTRTAEIVDRGVTTNLTVRTVTSQDIGSVSATTYDEITLPAIGSRQIFPGAAYLDKKCFGSPFDPSSVIRVPVTTDYSFTAPRVTIQTASPGLGLIDVTPTDVAEPHVALKGQKFPGKGAFLNASFTPASVAWRYIYQLWYLFDPTRVPQSRKASTFLNWTRLGMPPYTAELQVDIAGVAGPREVWRYVHGCLRSPQQTAQQISDALAAIRVSMSARDQILVKTKTLRPIQPSDLKTVGSVSVGGWTRAEP